MTDRMVYPEFPAYELASMTPERVSQVMERMPHNMAAAFSQAWAQALDYFERLRPMLDGMPADDCEDCQTTAGCRCNADNR